MSPLDQHPGADNKSSPILGSTSQGRCPFSDQHPGADAHAWIVIVPGLMPILGSVLGPMPILGSSLSWGECPSWDLSQGKCPFLDRHPRASAHSRIWPNQMSPGMNDVKSDVSWQQGQIGSLLTCHQIGSLLALRKLPFVKLDVSWQQGAKPEVS